jgi:hypothetical protein
MAAFGISVAAGFKFLHFHARHCELLHDSKSSLMLVYRARSSLVLLAGRIRGPAVTRTV